MSQSGEQSYYEIQLSNRHMILAFAVAVLLGVVVFTAGVMVGRGLPGEQLPEEGWVEAFASSSVNEPEGIDDTFFDQVTDPVGEPVVEAVTESSGALTDATESELPTLSVETPPTSEHLADLPKADPSAASGWVIQVKSTQSRRDAETLQAALDSAGYPAFIISAELNNKTFYRIRIGRYSTRSDAETVAVSLSLRGDVDTTWVTDS